MVLYIETLSGEPDCAPVRRIPAPTGRQTVFLNEEGWILDPPLPLNKIAPALGGQPIPSDVVLAGVPAEVC